MYCFMMCEVTFTLNMMTAELSLMVVGQVEHFSSHHILCFGVGGAWG
jgi:hypothetical protein